MTACIGGRRLLKNYCWRSFLSLPFSLFFPLSLPARGLTLKSSWWSGNAASPSPLAGLGGDRSPNSFWYILSSQSDGVTSKESKWRPRVTLPRRKTGADALRNNSQISQYVADVIVDVISR